MPETSNVPLMQLGMKILRPDLTPEPWFRDAWNALVLRTGTETSNTVLGVINGATQFEQQLAAEAAARIAGDQAVAGAGDGTGASNSGTWASGASVDASWTLLKALILTPGGAGGDYTISVIPDQLASIAPASGGIDTFNGNWRLVEELVGGGTDHVLASGTFAAEYYPGEEHFVGEGGNFTIIIGAYNTVTFNGLPGGLLPANESTQVEVRLEIQRASGATTVSALSGAMSVTWTA
jgi:hypothetical protein